MQMGKQYIARLQRVINQGPFGEDEARRVTGAGEQYIALSSARLSEKYIRQIVVDINNVSYTIYAKDVSG